MVGICPVTVTCGMSTHLRPSDLGFRVLGFRSDEGVGFRVWGLGFQVSDGLGLQEFRAFQVSSLGSRDSSTRLVWD